MDLQTFARKAAAYPPFLAQFARWKLGFCRRLRQHDPIFVFQMGKVASRSIYEPLCRTYRGAVVHGHGLSDDYPQGEVRELHRYLYSARPPRRLHVISLVREPISRNISAFFANFLANTGVTPDASRYSVRELRDLFLRNFPHDQPLTWMDQNIRRHLGIDVYATPFPEDGHARYEQGATRLLVMRCEIPDAEKERCVREFLQMPGFKLSHANVAADKSYSRLYREFGEQARFPAEYVDRICSSRMFTHFYPAETIARTRSRWTEEAASR